MPSSSTGNNNNNNNNNNAVVAIMAATAFAAGTLSGVILMKIWQDQKAKKARQDGMFSFTHSVDSPVVVDQLLFYLLLMSALLFLFLLLMLTFTLHYYQPVRYRKAKTCRSSMATRRS